MKRLASLSLLLAFLMPIATSPANADLSRAAGVKAAFKTPACRSAQMKVTLGFTNLEMRHNPPRWVGWVRYTNEGSSCLMSKLDVGVQAVFGKAHTPLGQGSIRNAPSRVPFILHPHSSARAVVELVETHTGPVLSCYPTPVDTIEITGYLYGWPKHYFSLARWNELAQCSGDHITAVGGVLAPL